MKVWLVNQYALTPSYSGGTRHYDLGRELAKRGHQVTIWATSRHHGTGQEMREHSGSSPVIEDIDGLTWVWLKTSPYRGNGLQRGLNMLSFAFSFLRAALSQTRHRVERPDLLVGSSVHLLAPLATLLLGRLWSLPVATEIRDLWPGTLIDAGMSAKHPAIIGFALIERILYKYSDSLISVLPKAQDHYMSLGARDDKIFVVPNGTALELADPGPRDGPFRLAYLGTLGHHNHLTTVIEAAEILTQEAPEIRIALIGAGPERDTLSGLIEEKGLANISVEQPVPKDQISRVFSEVDALIFHLLKTPIFRFGISPNKIFDYLASGRPIVFACEAANNPVAEAEAGISVPPEDPRSLAQGILALAALTQEERRRLGRNGQDFVRRHHSIIALADRFEEALCRTLP